MWSNTWSEAEMKPGNSHGLLTEITHLVSGLNKSQVLDVLSHAERIQ